jgi:hypothetical protein
MCRRSGRIITAKLKQLNYTELAEGISTFGGHHAGKLNNLYSRYRLSTLVVCQADA